MLKFNKEYLKTAKTLQRKGYALDLHSEYGWYFIDIIVDEPSSMTIVYDPESNTATFVHVVDTNKTVEDATELELSIADKHLQEVLLDLVEYYSKS